MMAFAELDQAGLILLTLRCVPIAAREHEIDGGMLQTVGGRAGHRFRSEMRRKGDGRHGTFFQGVEPKASLGELPCLRAERDADSTSCTMTKAW